MQKIKQFVTSEQGKNILIVLIVILVGTGSFQLGRLSKSGDSSSGVKIEYPNGELAPIQDAQVQPANALNALSATESISNITRTAPSSNFTAPTKKTSSQNFFASSRGKKYYPVGCSAGKSLKQENRIYFGTREEAEKAGYTLSASCK